MYTKQELQGMFTLNEHGLITNPGKFEGETLATPYFYHAQLEMGGDYVIEVDEQEKIDFGLDSINDNYIVLCESEEGFVTLEYFVEQAEAEDFAYEYYVLDTRLDDE